MTFSGMDDVPAGPAGDGKQLCQRLDRRRVSDRS
jgi:hypothetical protein